MTDKLTREVAEVKIDPDDETNLGDLGMRESGRFEKYEGLMCGARLLQKGKRYMVELVLTIGNIQVPVTREQLGETLRWTSL